MTDEREKAWMYFEIHKWPLLKQHALKWLMCEGQKKNEYWNFELMKKVAKRWRVGTAWAFYQMRPDLYF